MDDFESRKQRFYAELEQGLFNADLRELAINAGVDESYLTGKHCPCPLCGGSKRFRYKRTHNNTSPAFICNDCGSGRGGIGTRRFFAEFLGFSQQELNDWLAGQFCIDNPFQSETHVSKPKTVLRTKPKPVEKPKKKDNFNYLKRLWLESEVDNPLLSNYLTYRGLMPQAEMPHNVRLHPCLDYRTTDENGNRISLGKFPAILILCQAPSGSTSGIMRIFLQPDGYGKLDLKALGYPCEGAKRILPRGEWMDGFAGRLYPAGKRLAIAEGFETAMAIRRDHKLPVWYLYNDGNMALFNPPPEVEELFVLEDFDPPTQTNPMGAGQKAAVSLKDRLSQERPDLRVNIVKVSASDRLAWAKATGNNPNKCDFADIAKWEYQVKQKQKSVSA